jgi:phage-related protein
MKSVRWCGDSRSRIREFPKAARGRAGHELNRVQHGREPEDWKPMSSIGAGVNEIRVHVDGEHRVLYVAKFEDAIYVLHAFRKTTRKTPKPVLELASERYRAVLEERKRVKKR